jgi:UDP-N-acetylmuramate--alanine ligase
VEVRATLRAARSAYENRRLVVVFQPHRYTRLRDLMDDFSAAFNDCHVLVVCDVYAAGEAPLPGVDSHALCDNVRKLGHRDVTYGGSLEQVAHHIGAIARPGDLVLTLGAGTVYQVGEQFLEARGGTHTGAP